jgi:hypothetical protein
MPGVKPSEQAQTKPKSILQRPQKKKMTPERATKDVTRASNKREADSDLYQRQRLNTEFMGLSRG